MRLESGQIDPNTGFGPIVWDSWETSWTGVDVRNTTRERTETQGGEWRGWMGQPGGGRRNQFENRVTTTTRENLRETIETGVQTRTGNRTVVTEVFDETSVGDRVVSRDLIPFMRSRNVQFISKRMKPLTRIYAFFDGKDVTRYCVPKLLEIQMVAGTFTVGETVTGTVVQTGLGPDTTNNAARITFRVAQSNHKEGAYDVPTKTYPE